MGTGAGASEQRDNLFVPGQGMKSDGGYAGAQQVHTAYHQTGIGTPERAGTSLMLSMLLRAASLLLSLICVAIIASAESRIFATDINTGVIFQDNVKALRVRPYKFLVSAAAIVMFYELLQIIVSCIQTAQSNPFTSTYVGALLLFIFDHVFGYLMFAAATSGATYADLFRHYSDGTQCQLVGNLCAKVESGVAMGFLAFGCLAVLTLLSGFNFSKHVL